MDTTNTPSTSENKPSQREALGDRMKTYEAQWERKLDPKFPFIIRLDGHKFSSFTRHFKKPFDERVYNCMIATATDLLLEFKPSTVYTCSDEITMLFAAPLSEDEKKKEEEKATESKQEDSQKCSELEPTIAFGGRVIKLTTLTAGFASACFNRHLLQQKFDNENEKKLAEYIEKARPYFDARVFQVPSNDELVNNIIWRCHMDYRRNSISGMAQAYLGHKAIMNKNTKEMLGMLKEMGKDWESMPDAYKYGTFLKKEHYEKDAVNEKGEAVKAIRTRVVTKSFDFKEFSEENLRFIVLKLADFSSSLPGVAV